MAGIEIAGFGEAMVLFESPSLETASTVEVHVAGAELNLCAAAARLGVRTGFCSRVGADPLGRRILAEIQRLRVAADLTVTDDEHPTGLFLKEVHPDGERRVHYCRRGSAASMMDSSDAARLLATRPLIVAVSGITAALGPGPRTAIESLAAAGVRLAFDPNFRPSLSPLAAQVDFARKLLPHVSYLLLGIDEAAQIFGSGNVSDAFAAFDGEIVLKAGADGCFFRMPDGSAGHQPSLATQIVDPVGAGDAFAGGYLAARIRGATPASAARVGSVLAAGVVGASGDTNGLPDATTAAALLH